MSLDSLVLNLELIEAFSFAKDGADSHIPIFRNTGEDTCAWLKVLQSSASLPVSTLMAGEKSWDYV